MPLFFVGCGHMGGSIVDGMLKSKRFETEQIKVILPFHSPDSKKVQTRYNIQVFSEIPKAVVPRAVIFAVKPQTFPEIIPYYSSVLPKSTLIISIAAGKSISFFKKHFPKNKIVRTMPNLNAMVGYGSAVGVTQDELDSSQRQLVENIFGSVGSFSWVDDESLIDAVTAISGSGPAYYFLFTELLEKAAIGLGLPAGLAKNLARETFIGSAHTLENSDQAVADLRAAVTSKGGTTEAAMEVLSEPLKILIEKATIAATKRGKDLGS
ncbi:MAG: pyrroline-5-carboxylate reductase [Rickettsiales bacterium]